MSNSSSRISEAAFAERSAAFDEVYKSGLMVDITTFVRNLIKYAPDSERWVPLLGDEWRAEVMCTIVMNFLEDLRDHERLLWLEECAQATLPGRARAHDARTHLESSRGIAQVIEVVGQGIPVFVTAWTNDEFILSPRRSGASRS